MTIYLFSFLIKINDFLLTQINQYQLKCATLKKKSIAWNIAVCRIIFDFNL